MGTRGVIGWITPEGEVKAMYNHIDSYPTELGEELQSQLRVLGDELPALPADVLWVDPTDKPGPSTLAAFKDKNLHSAAVSTGDDWYAALRHMQGRLDLILEEKIAIDQGLFIQDSLFCEWGYLIDERTNEMVVLRGFNKDRDQQAPYARVADADSAEYFGCTEVWRGAREAFLDLDMDQFERSICGE